MTISISTASLKSRLADVLFAVVDHAPHGGHQSRRQIFYRLFAGDISSVEADGAFNEFVLALTVVPWAEFLNELLSLRGDPQRKFDRISGHKVPPILRYPRHEPGKRLILRASHGIRPPA